MIVRPAPQGPVILTFRFLDRQIIDAGVTVMHNAPLVKLPVLVPVRPEPVAGIVVPLVGEADCNAGPVESSQLLDKSII